MGEDNAASTQEHGSSDVEFDTLSHFLVDLSDFFDDNIASMDRKIEVWEKGVKEIVNVFNEIKSVYLENLDRIIAWMEQLEDKFVEINSAIENLTKHEDNWRPEDVERLHDILVECLKMQNIEFMVIKNKMK